MEPLTVVAQLWERIGARDWDGVAGLIAEDAVIEWPVSGERTLWTVRDGEIVDAREHWTSPGQDPAPRWRAGYVEPLVAD
ncbi:hypothetical protein AB0B78_01810 [Streptomyces sp. NPDC040724]|uniref:hypothetical protein n=1 Tax=Streptomyces sp. NPDC040724 TaxID=3155612 RepID=UPI0033DA676B